MSKTKLSLYYLASYLTFGGLGFLILPQFVLTLFFATGTYSDMMVQIVGVLLLSLGIVIIQIIRHEVSALYPTTLIIRSVIIIAFTVLYLINRDPLMITLLIIVGLGFVLTLSSFFLDKRNG